MNNFKKLYWQKRLIDFKPKHYFDVNLADFEQIINNDFVQLGAEWLDDIKNYFSGGGTNLK